MVISSVLRLMSAQLSAECFAVQRILNFLLLDVQTASLFDFISFIHSTGSSKSLIYMYFSHLAPEVTDCLWSALDTQRLLNVINVIIPCKSIALLSAYKTNYDTLIKVFCSKCTSISKKMMTLISENIKFMSKSSDV